MFVRRIVLLVVTLAISIVPGKTVAATPTEADPPPVYTNEDLPPVPYHWRASSVPLAPVGPTANPAGTDTIPADRPSVRVRRPHSADAGHAGSTAATRSRSARARRGADTEEQRIHRLHQLWQSGGRTGVNIINRINRLWPDRDGDPEEARRRAYYRELLIDARRGSSRAASPR